MLIDGRQLQPGTSYLQRMLCYTYIIQVERDLTFLSMRVEYVSVVAYNIEDSQ